MRPLTPQQTLRNCRRFIQGAVAVLVAVGMLGALGSGSPPRHNQAPAVPQERKTVENMCDHLPTYTFADGSSYNPWQGCLTQQRLMQNKGLSGDFGTAVERYTHIVCERAHWQGICQNDLKQRAL